MTSLKPWLALIGALVLAGPFTPAQADTAGAACDGVSVSDARRAAREAEKIGAHQRAAECFLIGGENYRAHRAMLRAAGDTSAAAKQKAAVAAASARDQARRLRAAFR
jgi:hypothetical protein